MEELSQKEQISAIFIPSDTDPTSVGAKSGFAGFPWDLGNAPAFFRAALIGSTGKLHFLLFVFPSWGFLCTNISGTEGGGAPEEQWDTHLGLVGFNDLKGLFQPKICDSKAVLITATTQGLSQPSSHPFL